MYCPESIAAGWRSVPASLPSRGALPPGPTLSPGTAAAGEMLPPSRCGRTRAIPWTLPHRVVDLCDLPQYEDLDALLVGSSHLLFPPFWKGPVFCPPFQLEDNFQPSSCCILSGFCKAFLTSCCQSSCFEGPLSTAWGEILLPCSPRGSCEDCQAQTTEASAAGARWAGVQFPQPQRYLLLDFRRDQGRGAAVPHPLSLSFMSYFCPQTIAESCKAASVTNTNAEVFSCFCQCCGQSQNQLLPKDKLLKAEIGSCDLLSLLSFTYWERDSLTEKRMFCDSKGVIRKVVKMASHVTSSLFLYKLQLGTRAS